jgi:hypothetical protein
MTVLLGAMRIGGRMGAYAVGSVQLARPVVRGFVPGKNGTGADFKQERNSYAGLRLSTLKAQTMKLVTPKGTQCRLETLETVRISVCLPTLDMRNFSVGTERHLLLAKRLGRPTFCPDHEQRNER